MTTIPLLTLGLIAVLVEGGDMLRLRPGETHQFDYYEDRYWLKMHWYGSFDFVSAQRECESEHGADVVNLIGEGLYRKLRREFAVTISTDWSKDRRWIFPTYDPFNYPMSVFRQTQHIVTNTTITNVTQNHSPSVRGEGYICHRRKYKGGSSYHFKYNGDDYWFRIDWRRFFFKDAQLECQRQYSAEVVSISDDAQYEKVRSQVEDKIPIDWWRKTIIWTNDSNRKFEVPEGLQINISVPQIPGISVTLEVWRHGTGRRSRYGTRHQSDRANGYVCIKKNDNLIGRTYEFVYDGNDYWFVIDRPRTFRFADAESQCRRRYKGFGELVKVIEQAQYAEIRNQVNGRIPSNWNEVMLWTNTKDSQSERTHEMLVIGKGGNEGWIRKVNRKPRYRGNGYVCFRRNNVAGNSYKFDFGGIRYWLKHDWRSMVSYHGAVDGCAMDYKAEVATARSEDVYREFQKQIEYRMPPQMHVIRIWTRDENVVDTRVVLEVWGEGRGGPNQKIDSNIFESAHGHLCQKQISRRMASVP